MIPSTGNHPKSSRETFAPNDADRSPGGHRHVIKFNADHKTVISPATAHLGHARRTGGQEWLAVNNYGQPVATIWSPYLGSPGIFRCEPLPHARYVDAVEGEDFTAVLDYALNHFSPAH
jgi:hypothetical protein